MSLDAAPAHCLIRVCRDCCCGTDRKHPDVDHDGLLAGLRAGARGRATVLVSPCLLACAESNVVILSPSPLGRRLGGRPVWLREVLDVETVENLVDWVRAGGPGLAPVPEPLAGRTFRPSRLAARYAQG